MCQDPSMVSDLSSVVSIKESPKFWSFAFYPVSIFPAFNIIFTKTVIGMPPDWTLVKNLYKTRFRTALGTPNNSPSFPLDHATPHAPPVLPPNSVH